ncbi:DNA polymerase III subunit delta' [Roseivivax halodurans JCM 10272]|uniref:DNA polymerase III subunit delta n=1 Tax=Roseivivax halodurans JCM 10272 TaxID=1449350 RepID=X7EIH9_9RHOB|nr:DNA polymerase III subunit delta' [Roseivivax halodurans]ETX14933.1 DNA polymerase III subunit delta' [Roseivivax halodurans JCM 10272]
MSDPLPEPDRVEGAPHPRETMRLVGQEAAERGFLDAYAGDRLHHAWLITGPEGVGKATLAWRIARFLVATPPAGSGGLLGDPEPPQTLDIGADHPVTRRSLALAEPSIFLLRRGLNDKGDRIAADIRVADVRGLKRRMALSSADGGRRAIVVDAADEMNVNAANALLKLLEEPPANTVLLLVCHRPARLLPTIRSRCRELRLAALGPDEMAEALSLAGAEVSPQETEALTELSAGSVGAALRLLNLGGLQLYGDLVDLMGTMPDMSRPKALALADRVATRGRETQLDLLIWLTDLALARLARTGVTGTPPARAAHPEEPRLLARLAPDPRAGRAWAEIAQSAGDRARHGRAVNIDAAALIFDMVSRIRDTAADVAA